ncbi:hypothetical protein ACWEO2_34350 [Nocardia sp. NPDC004278]
MTADGYVTTPDGWPPQVIDPVHGPGSHGIAEFLRSCAAALMGRTTFEPALTADRWPWPEPSCLPLQIRIQNARA